MDHYAQPHHNEPMDYMEQYGQFGDGTGADTSN